MKKGFDYLKKIKQRFVEYIATNRLFISFVLLSFVMTVLVRNYTIGNPWDYKPIIVDLALIVIIGAFGYLFRPQKQFNYYFVWMIIIMLMCVINSVYYTFYVSFASFGLLSTLSQVGEVTDSLTEKLKLVDFIYVIFPLFFYYIHRMLNSTTYYSMVSKVEKGKKMFAGTLVLGAVLLAFTIVSLTGTDYSRLSKQWNREYIVQRLGIILYQGNDLIQSLTPKISSLFGYDEAVRKFREFYTELFAEREQEDHTNKYTGILEGKNVIFIHMESMQAFFVDLKINGEEVTPVLNQLTKEGMYFSNFYSQTSTGTSSDTEFTLNTSLMPALSSTVFMSYYNRDYISIEKLLKEKGYYTFSAHGNKGGMWNRDKMHPNLGYDQFFDKEYFDVNSTNTVGLGISDQAFFQQLLPKLEDIEKKHKNYMGTIITLSNHSPFAATKDGNPDLYYTYGKLDLTNTYEKVDEETGTVEVVTDDYLEGTKLGNYIHSVHYADLALGEFIEMIKNSDKFNDTVFVFYGDHDAKLSMSEYQYYYNYDVETGVVHQQGDPEYYEYDYYQHELNRRTPLIIWTKDASLRRKLKTVNDNVMGMYDIMPTLGNMMGFENPFALGHDIYDIKEDNVVIFSNGNFLTNYVYYNNSDSAHYVLKEGVELEENYISDLRDYTDKVLDVSNSIIVHDLIKKEGDKLLVGKGETVNE